MSLKKMLVVTPEIFERGQSKIYLSELDKEMYKILDRRDLNDTEKWHLYKRSLDKYLNMVSLRKKPINIPIVKQEPSVVIAPASNVVVKKKTPFSEKGGVETFKKASKRHIPLEHSLIVKKSKPESELSLLAAQMQESWLKMIDRISRIENVLVEPDQKEVKTKKRSLSSSEDDLERGVVKNVTRKLRRSKRATRPYQAWREI